MQADIRLIHLYQNWCKCRFTLGNQSCEIYGETPAEPIEYFNKLKDFLSAGGLRAHCTFNMPHSSHLLELRRRDDTIEILIYKYNFPFQNTLRKLGKIIWSQLIDREDLLEALDRAIENAVKHSNYEPVTRERQSGGLL